MMSCHDASHLIGHPVIALRSNSWDNSLSKFCGNAWVYWFVMHLFIHSHFITFVWCVT